MSKSWRAVLSLTFPAVLLFCGVAAAADWRVAKLSGHVVIRSGPLQGVALTNGMILKSGSVLVTDGNGRALLVHGGDQMIVSPNSMVAVPADRAGMTAVLQRYGEIELNVDRQSKPHFMVQTPFLAAIVKGTRFTVRVLKRSASVVVRRGRVEVHDLLTGEKTDVLAGQTALVGRGWHLQVSGQGPLSPIQHGGPRATRSNPGSVGTTAAVVGGKAGTTTSAGVATFGANGGVAGGSLGTGGISADVTGGGIRTDGSSGDATGTNGAGCTGSCGNGNGGDGTGNEGQHSGSGNGHGHGSGGN